MTSNATKRFLGLELGGSRRTAVLALDFHPDEKKVFLGPIHTHLHGSREETADEVLIRTVNSLGPAVIGVDAPLTLPPARLEGPSDAEAIEWMRQESERRGWHKGKLPAPYTHRPIDLLLRGRWQDDSPIPIPAEEAFGSGRAPLTARIHYLRGHFSCKNLLEVSPRFALLGISSWYGISVRELRRARDLQHGAENRFTILNKLAAKNAAQGMPHIFLYMTDVVAIAKDLSTFDSFLCALMGICQELNLLEEPELAPGWGYVARPKSLPQMRRSDDIWSDS